MVQALKVDELGKDWTELLQALNGDKVDEDVTEGVRILSEDDTDGYFSFALTVDERGLGFG